MKIYCSRRHNYTLDDFIGKPYWVLCYISRSPYMTNYLVKPISKIGNKYACQIIHQNFIGVNDVHRPYMEHTLDGQDIHIVEPLELYSDTEQSNWISMQQYDELHPADDEDDGPQFARIGN